jgi:hypothetical protein
MNMTNTKKLLADFPRLFRNAAGAESCMPPGFECDDGWFETVHELAANIEARAKGSAFGLDPQSEEWPRAVQVIDKLGTLTFYCVSGSHRDWFHIGRMAGKRNPKQILSKSRRAIRKTIN